MTEYRAVGTQFVFPPEWPQAATLLLVAGPADERVVVLTERAHHLALHPGDMSLPGGRVHEGERTWEAALREANEELGIDTSATQDLGFLGYFRAAGSRYRIAAHAGLLPLAPALDPNPHEVHRVVLVALDHVVDLGRYSSIVSPRMPNSQSIAFAYPEVPDVSIIGATARMLLAFAQRFDRGDYASTLGPPAPGRRRGDLPLQI